MSATGESAFDHLQMHGDQSLHLARGRRCGRLDPRDWLAECVQPADTLLESGDDLCERSRSERAVVQWSGRLATLASSRRVRRCGRH